MVKSFVIVFVLWVAIIFLLCFFNHRFHKFLERKKPKQGRFQFGNEEAWND